RHDAFCVILRAAKNPFPCVIPPPCVILREAKNLLAPQPSEFSPHTPPPRVILSEAKNPYDVMQRFFSGILRCAQNDTGGLNDTGWGCWGKVFGIAASLPEGAAIRAGSLLAACCAPSG